MIQNVLIEGWRGVNHSFAMVNQYQIRELLRMDRVHLFHRDMPFAFRHWDRAVNKAGFTPSDQAQIDAVPEPTDERIDHIYRIVSPFRAPAPGTGQPTTTFMITELGLSDSSFSEGSKGSSLFTDDGNAIVTSSYWSRARIVEYGFPADKVSVVPLGVDATLFSPLGADERAAGRLRLGIRDDETLFLNIGVAVWNKGIDLVLRSFARLCARGRRVRLILKDQRDVYGISVEQTIHTVGQSMPELLQAETLAAISVIPGNLDRQQLRQLYGIADCYVSPYRAEGFNLPVIEAIACGTPVIVTRGGATDDFCDDAVACRIHGRLGQHQVVDAGYVGRFIEPEFDDLVTTMDGFALGRGLPAADFDASRLRLLERFSWRRVATALVEHVIFPGQDRADAGFTAGPSAAPPNPPRRVGQHEILDLLAMARPLSMAHGKKLRIGQNHDGGYVVPDIALTCNAVLSIGVGSDVSFDLALAERGATIAQFDHTVEGPPVQHPNFRFHRRGWGTQTGGALLDFVAILAMTAAPAAANRLLKFDIEGAEYGALETVDADILAEFSVIVCEFHDLSRLQEPHFFDLVYRSLSKLTLFHAPVHLHANNYGRLVLLDGVPVPDVLEISLLRRDLDVFDGVSSDPVPGPLDRPNHPLLPDLCLTAFAAASTARQSILAKRHAESYAG